MKAPWLSLDLKFSPIKAYDSHLFREQLKARNCQAVLPNKSHRKEKAPFCQEVYQDRHVIECFLGKLKHFLSDILTF